MNAMVWSSPAPMAHPPRSNPFLRSSSVVPPLPCITPSTVTWVMVVSLMLVVLPSLGPALLGHPLWAAPHPYHEHVCPDPTPSPGSCWRKGRSARLAGPELAVAGVTEPGLDVALLVEAAVEGRAVDLDIGVRRRDRLDPFGGRDQVDE